jgi:hypothetical protein
MVQFIRISLAIEFLLLAVILSGCGSSYPDNKQAQGQVLPVITSTPERTSNSTIISPSSSTHSKDVTPTAFQHPKISTVVNTTSAPSNLLLQDWNISWKQGLPCRLPCWQGISPGKTTKDEALEILKKISYINPNTIISDSTDASPVPGVSSGTIRWNWINGNRGGSVGFKLGNSNPTIESIGLIFNEPCKLKDIIETYGPPSHVEANYNLGGFSLIFWWMSYTIWTGIATQRAEPLINGDIKIGDKNCVINTTTPVSPEQVAAYSQYDSKMFVSWQGYKDFYFYCRIRETGVPCKP